MLNTVLSLQAQKNKQQKITMLTAYDFTTAKLFDEAGINMLLVGDSLGMVMLGYEDTLSVTMADMLHHTKAVSRAAKSAFVVADLPFLSYHVSTETAVINAGRLIQEGGANAVKLEGGEGGFCRCHHCYHKSRYPSRRTSRSNPTICQRLWWFQSTRAHRNRCTTSD